VPAWPDAGYSDLYSEKFKINLQIHPGRLKRTRCRRAKIYCLPWTFGLLLSRDFHGRRLLINSAGGQSKNRVLFIGPAAAVLVGLTLHVGANLPAGACWTAAITTLCGLWWIFEPIPIPATAILPFALFPLVGVMDDKAVAAGYGHHIVLLFAGGFMLAQALEKSGAHRRLAILMIRAVGGWSGLVGAGGVGDSTVALLAAVALFLCPNGHGGRLLDWKTARKIPWGILLLFGAGLTIAKAFKASGLDDSIGELLTCLKGCHPLPMIAGLSLSIGFITEVMSNTAMSAMVLPLLAAAAKVNGISPALLMIPATMSVSLAFMLPIATPPNAIVYSSGHLSVRTMVREGFFMTLIGAATVAVVCYLTLPFFVKQ